MERVGWQSLAQYNEIRRLSFRYFKAVTNVSILPAAPRISYLGKTGTDPVGSKLASPV